MGEPEDTEAHDYTAEQAREAKALVESIGVDAILTILADACDTCAEADDRRELVDAGERIRHARDIMTNDDPATAETDMQIAAAIEALADHAGDESDG